MKDNVLPSMLAQKTWDEIVLEMKLGDSLSIMVAFKAFRIKSSGWAMGNGPPIFHVESQISPFYSECNKCLSPASENLFFHITSNCFSHLGNNGKESLDFN